MTQWGNDTLSLPLLADPARRHGAFEKGIMHVAALGSPGLVGSTVWNSPGFSTWNETAGFGCYKWMWRGVVESNRKYRKDVCAVQIWCLLWLCEAFSSNWPCMHVILLQSQAATKFLLMDKSSGLKKKWDEGWFKHWNSWNTVCINETLDGRNAEPQRKWKYKPLNTVGLKYLLSG